jgi:hypothetical protein
MRRSLSLLQALDHLRAGAHLELLWEYGLPEQRFFLLPSGRFVKRGIADEIMARTDVVRLGGRPPTWKMRFVCRRYKINQRTRTYVYSD